MQQISKPKKPIGQPHRNYSQYASVVKWVMQEIRKNRSVKEISNESGIPATTTKAVFRPLLCTHGEAKVMKTRSMIH